MLLKQKIIKLIFRIIRKLAIREPVVVIVSSLGRSGSTMLTKSIASGMIKQGLYKKLLNYGIPFIKEAWNLATTNFSVGYVYKTHDYPVNIKENNYKYIFTYSDPLELIISLDRMKKYHDENWIKNHYAHLHSIYNLPNEYLKKDSLNLEKLFDAWIEIDEDNLYCIALDDLWDHKDKIEDFLGFNFELPIKRNREKNIESDLEDNNQLSKVYETLISKIEKHSNLNSKPS